MKPLRRLVLAVCLAVAAPLQAQMLVGDLYLQDTDNSHTAVLTLGSNLTAHRTLQIITGDANRTLTIAGDASVSGTNTGDQTLNSLLPTQTGHAGKFLQTDGTNTAWTAVAATAANPTASVGLAAVNGSASTYMRSDAAPPIDQGMSPTWTGAHKFGNTSLRLQEEGSGAQYLLVASKGSMTADRTLNFNVNDSNREINLSNDLFVTGLSTINQNVSTTGSPTFSNVKVGNFGGTPGDGIGSAGATNWGLMYNGARVGRVTSTGLNEMAIGATTPSTGAFTTLSSTGNTTVHGGNDLRLSNSSNNLDVQLYNAGASGQANFKVRISGVDYLTQTTSGLAVTGTTTSTGKIASTVASGGFGLQVEAGARIALDGGSNTYIEESSADTINFVTGGSSRATLSSSGLQVTGFMLATGEVRGSVGAAIAFNGINTSSGNSTIQCWNQDTAGNNTFVNFYTEGGGGSLRGGITYNRGSGVVAYNTTSDEWLKEDIQPVSTAELSRIVEGVRLHRYLWKEGKSPGVGVLAQELHRVAPFAVTAGDTPTESFETWRARVARRSARADRNTAAQKAHADAVRAHQAEVERVRQEHGQAVQARLESLTTEQLGILREYEQQKRLIESAPADAPAAHRRAAETNFARLAKLVAQLPPEPPPPVLPPEPAPPVLEHDPEDEIPDPALWGVDYSKLVVPLIAHAQLQAKKITTLEERLAALEARLAALEAVAK